ncbi:hypothetical protein R1sor_024671 [Riccia sorocarpa]|uniref:Uncharacterized protein n=1 Tax=Riccia sorocarpa TaxID=122646 RepID=A0ABD3GUD1_9MARC
MGTDYDKKAPSFLNMAADNVYPSEVAPSYAPSQYDGWNNSNRTEFAQLCSRNFIMPTFRIFQDPRVSSVEYVL